MRVRTEADIFRAYQAAASLKPSEMALALGISRQSMNNYFQGTKPLAGVVLNWFVKGSEDWVREMALDIFKGRPEIEVPCLCLEQIGDKGPCPRHAAVLVDG